MSNILNIQQQIKQNAEELSEYLSDLRKWSENKNQESKSQARTAIKQRNLPPVRNTETIKHTEPSSTKKSTEEQPDSDETKAVSLKNQGNVHFKNKEYKKAIEFYNKSLMIKEDPILYCNRSAAQFHLKKYEASELDASKAIILDQSYTKAYIRRAFARRELHNYEGSVQDFEKALQLDPNNKEAMRELEKVKKLLQEQRKKEKENQPKKRMVIEEVEEEEIEEIVTPSASKLPSSKKAEERKPEQPISKHIQQTVAKAKKEPETKQPSTSTDSTSKVAKQSPIASLPKIRVQIPTQPPLNSYEFEKTFNELDREDFYEYLKIIPPANFSRLFKESLTDKMLNIIIESLEKVFLKSDELAERALEILENISKVSRFDMIIMFLNDKDKKQIETLFKTLQAKLPSRSEQIKKLKSKFE
jgi:tetratricopeptide (TPR) repeat protein